MALQACQEAVVRGVLADEHAGLTEGRACGQEAGDCLELTLGLPEVGDVVTQCGELTPKPEGDIPNARLRAVKPASTEELENLPWRGREMLIRGRPQPTKRRDCELHLRHVGLAARASLAMGLEPIPLLRRHQIG